MVRSLRAPNSPNPGSKTTNFSQVLIVLALGLLLTAGFSTPVHAQGSLALGSVQHVTALLSCPGSGWFVTHCSTATIANCANVKDMGFTFGYIYPTAPYRGTIVFLTGGDGTIPATDPGAELTYAGDYFNAGYEIVQIAWNYGWELTDVPGVPGPPPAPNIQYAACRPATFLQYVHDNYFTRTLQTGMCAQGGSAASAAIAYSLAYYGLGSALDKVELLAGPPLSDIKQGCKVPFALEVEVCGQNMDNQFGCRLGPFGSTWSKDPGYITPAVNGVSSWTADSTCRGSSNTSPSSNLAWYKASIVDDGTNGPTFSYPHTAMGAFLCRTLQSEKTECSGSHFDQMHCANNTSEQGQIFYAAITANNVHPLQYYAIYAVDKCLGPEGVSDNSTSVVPGFTALSNPTGFAAIEWDMINDLVNGCVNHH
jgi:hypothetical protein